MPEIKGLDIKEVWDYRLSSAVPLIDNSGPEWLVHLFAKNSPNFYPDGDAASAESIVTHATGIVSEPGDSYDAEKVKICFEWLKSVRDNFALDDIEDLKPLVKKLRADEAELHNNLSVNDDTGSPA